MAWLRFQKTPYSRKSTNDYEHQKRQTPNHGRSGNQRDSDQQSYREVLQGKRPMGRPAGIFKSVQDY